MTFLLLSSISFDSSKVGIFWTLCTGGNLVITEKRIEQDIEKISQVIERNKITTTLMLPSLYKVILSYAEKEKLQSLNNVIIAGEVCDISICKKHFNTLPNVTLVNEYGPTEATVWCTAHKILLEDLNLKRIPIGVPVANAEIYILDDDLKQVKIGDIGEIFIGGNGLSNGYINRDDLTAKAFINSPYFPNKKLYKTGDLGKFNSNGTIDFLGRKDQQVKLRGFRVELSEIEHTIKTYSGAINEAVALLDEGSNISPTELANFKEEDIIEILKTFNENEFENLLNSIENLSTVEKKRLLNLDLQ